MSSTTASQTTVPANGKPGSNGNQRAYREMTNARKLSYTVATIGALLTGAWFVLDDRFQSKTDAATHEKVEAVQNATFTEVLKSINVTLQKQALDTEKFQGEMRADHKEFYKRLPPQRRRR